MHNLGMARPIQSKEKHRFDAALKTYLAAIDASKRALIVAVNEPTRESDDAYDKASGDEKDARKEYRKATKMLRDSIEKRQRR
jgi:hypothetical protein